MYKIDNLDNLDKIDKIDNLFWRVNVAYWLSYELENKPVFGEDDECWYAVTET